ncbi:hypothetical protein BS47DRAFT_1338839 [Hydnum rufescens UP504]|uniref:Oxo-4-hydroxy-4-carboxy-5-ureidoimidazoline decarboxylase domain-containing protein n=1 Tax=Hydnum rufescens UP504 TaxID=1448309 RepID=A0A9P6DWZ4_9AGAM|nr:hypothetical protein BS47DRAFT_1338839 [Hydnum rufescens UP504]
MTLSQWQDFTPGPSLLPTLSVTLSLLFESSPILLTKLVPELANLMAHPSFKAPRSYHDLIEVSLRHIQTWSLRDRALFISGHPRIGERGKLSALSQAEQVTKVTSQGVLERLEALNALYERSFPGLRYITFVNGRSREDIIPEIGNILELPIDPSQPSVITIHKMGSPEWMDELARAICAVGLIAHSRVKALELA